MRYYGWTASNSRMTRDRIRRLVWLWLESRCGRTAWTYWLGSGVAPPPEQRKPQPPRCSHCGEELQLIGVIDAVGRTVYRRTLPAHVTDYLDSG